MVTPHEILAKYYEAPDVRARIAEYCGRNSAGPLSTFDIAGYGGRNCLHETDGAPVVMSDRESLLAQGADICRSLADRGGAILQLDVDYTNHRDPAEPYRAPADCFARIEPVYQAILEVFARYRARPLAVMTGRGYHFTLRVPRAGRFYSDLLQLGLPPPSLLARYSAMTRPRDAADMGRAHDAGGRLLEHLAHEVVRNLHGHAPVPVALADVAPPGGGPFICLDLTAYADPLFQRHARCAFSGNQKASLTGIAPERPFVINLPREGTDRLEDLLADRENVERARGRAEHSDTRIPDIRDASLWVEEHRRGRLASFHQAFDAGPAMPRESWPYTYDSLDLGALPLCAGQALQFPNPALLVPVHLRTVALALWGMGWHPRSVAALVRSRYEKDFGWRGLWQRYDATARAEFYVRVFCGAIVGEIEQPADFTCESQALRGACPSGRCRWELGHLRAAVS